MTTDLSIPLSDEELEELDKFLLSDATSDDTMLLDVLDGYLTAIVIGPTSIPPSKWLPRIWGESPDDSPEYETVEEAQRILGLIMRHMNSIVATLQHDPNSFDPMLSATVYEKESREYLDGEMWSCGFMDGINLCREDWQPLFDDPDAMKALRPIYLLGAEELPPAEEKLTRWPNQREELTEWISDSVATMYRFWLPYRDSAIAGLVEKTVVRNGPKTGRNDLCPCGSGKKFKKCCGATTTLH